MAHINPTWPKDGDPGWGDTLNANFNVMTNQLNSHDDLIASIGAGTAPPSATTTSQGIVQLAGDLSGSAGAPVLKTVTTAGTAGSSSSVPVITWDAKGRVTAVSTATLPAAAPLASPAFTGTPTAPTAASGTSSTQIATTAFVASAVSGVTGGGGGGGGTTDAATPYGVVFLDSFAGADDDTKLTAALTAVTGDTYPRAIQLSARAYTFNTARSAFDGLRIIGPDGYSNPERGGGSKSTMRIALGMSGAWITSNGTNYQVSLHNLTFVGGSNSSVLAGTFYCLSMKNIFSSGLRSVLGTQASKLLLTAATFSGDWEINNCYSGAFHLGGSDNTFWTNGMLLDSSTAFNTAGAANGQYHLWLDGMEKTTVGPVYITCEGGWGGVWVSGSAFGSTSNNQGGPIIITGAKIEGRNAGAPCNGANVRVDGGIVTLRDCWVSYGMANTSAFGNGDLGVIHHSGGQLNVAGCTYDHASSVAETTPWVYTTSNADCIVSSTFRASKGGAWTGRPRFAKPTANAENRISDTTTTLISV